MKNMVIGVIALAVSTGVSALPKVSFKDVNVDEQKRIVLYLNDTETLTGTAAEVDKKTNGGLSAAIENAEASADFGKSNIFYGISPFAQITVVGVGDGQLSAAKLQDLGGIAAASSPTDPEKQVAILTNGLATEVENPAAWLALGASLPITISTSTKIKAHKPMYAHWCLIVQMIKRHRKSSQPIFNI